MNERNPMETFKMHSQEEEEISHPDIYGIDLEGPIPELQNEDSVVIPGGRLCLIDFLLFLCEGYWLTAFPWE